MAVTKKALSKPKRIAARDRVFVPYSQRLRRREMMREGRWPSADAPPALHASVARELVPLVDRMARGSIQGSLDRALSLPPRAGGPLFELELDHWSPEATFHDYLTDSRCHHIDVVEVLLHGSTDRRRRDSVAHAVNATWRRLGYAFHLRLVRGCWYAYPYRSKHLDDDLVDDAFMLLEHHQFSGPLGEFEKALRHLGKDDDNACVEANKAFESTMKAIWEKIEPTARIKGVADDLMREMVRLGILPAAWTAKMQLLPVIRSQPGAGHGSGSKPKHVERHVAELAVHLAASFIVFLIRQYDAKHGGASP